MGGPILDNALTNCQKPTTNVAVWWRRYQFAPDYWDPIPPTVPVTTPLVLQVRSTGGAMTDLPPAWYTLWYRRVTVVCNRAGVLLWHLNCDTVRAGHFLP